MKEKSIIKIKDVMKYYDEGTIQEVRALNGVSFEIKPGEIVNIVGVSGSGKSTLLNILGCMDHPTSGYLEVNGIEIKNLQGWMLSKIRNEQIGFIFQDMFLLPNLSAIENILLPLLPYKISNDDKNRAKTLLEAVGLTDKEKSKPHELSGGQKQRVAICRSLINNPAILLADEPTGNLDSNTGTEILQLLKEINHKLDMTIIIVTHDPKVDQVSQRKLEILDGKLISDEPVIN